MARRFEKEESIKLIKEGKTLNQIVKLVHASKGIVSLWVRDVQLTKEQKATIHTNWVLATRYKPINNDGTLRKKRQSSTNPKKIYHRVKQQRNKIMSTWRNKLRKRAVEYKGGKCEIEGCGYNACIDALEFHHENPEEKEYTIARYPYGWGRLKKELDKCKLVCSNHHKEIHRELRRTKNNKNYLTHRNK
jgi:hypothetical protein